MTLSRQYANVQLEIQTDDVKNAFDINLFAGVYFEIVFHDYTQVQCHRQPNRYRNEEHTQRNRSFAMHVRVSRPIKNSTPRRTKSRIILSWIVTISPMTLSSSTMRHQSQATLWATLTIVSSTACISRTRLWQPVIRSSPM